MRFDLDKVDTGIAYKLLANTVMPRPIAWVVTKGDARLNATRGIDELGLAARSYGNDYVRSQDTFSLDRPFWDDETP